jgi:ABC-2 type transport system ATP-binding protein
MGDSPALLEVEGLTHAYGSLPAVQDVSLRLDAGELVALVGRNGAGKSTLMRCIAAWSPVSRGDVRILGTSVIRRERRARRHALLVPDTPPFWDDLTAWEHLRFVAGAHRLERDWPERAGALLELFGLEERRDAFPAGLSRGMRHKLALAMALLLHPDLLLLDEPFGPLDPLSASRLWARLVEAAAGGQGVLVSCHQWPAEAVPDRCIVMEGGRVRADGRTGDLARTYGLPTVTPEGLLRAVVDRAGDEDEEPGPERDG